MFTGKRERALEEELRAAQEKADKNQRNLEKHLQELEEQMTSVEQVAEQSEAAAGAIYSTILAGKNGLESFRASHTVFLGKVKEQSDKVSEAAEEGRKVQQKAEELLTKFAEPEQPDDICNRMKNGIDQMHEFSGKMSVLALNAAIEAGRLGETGSNFITAAEEIRSFAGEYESAAQQMEELLHQLEEQNRTLKEELRELQENAKSQAVLVAQTAMNGKKTMAEYEAGQVQIQELIPDEALDRLDALRQAQTQMLHWKEEIQSEMTEMKGKLTW